jgi:hypothetical protein
MLLNLQCRADSNPSLSATQSEVQRNPLVVPRKSREIPANSLVFIVKPDQRKSFVLALHLDALPIFSDRQASSPVSAIPVGE